MALLDRGLSGRRDDRALLVNILDGGAVTYGPDVALALDPEGEIYFMPVLWS